MPLTAGQWGSVVTKAGEDLDSAMKLATAYDANATYPAALPGVTKYQGTMSGATRTAIRTDFLALIDGVISALTTARNTP